MRSKLASLILLSFFNLAFGWTPINPDNAPSIQQDPFINNAINISNWQSGGKFDDFGYFRGNVANEKSTVSINPVMNFRMGSFSVQNATLTGTHYFETRFNNHPHWEHSPFDEVRENSASSKESFISGSQSGYDMSWKTLKIHPGDGYDGAQGGGYPTPAGAYDAYYVNLDGFATATYFVPIWDKVEIPTNNSKDPLENIANAHQSGKDKITSSIYSDKSIIEKMLGVFNGTVEATIGTVGAGVGTPFNNVTEYGWNQYLHTTGNIEVKSVQMLPVSVQNDYINFIGNSLTQESMAAVTNAATLWTASGAKNKPNIKPITPTNAINHNYLRELANQGIKYSSESIVRVEKMPDGRIIFLESGTSKSGLKHIIQEHGKEFAQMGVPESQIPKVIFDTLRKGKIIGQQSKDGSRPIYETTINGQKYKLAITVGDNGYIVGVNTKGSIK